MKENLIYRKGPHCGGANTNAAGNDSQYAQEAQTASGNGGCLLRDALRESIGCYIVSDHLVGTNELQRQEGLLIRVESNFYVLYDQGSDTQLFCEYYSLRFFRCWPRGRGNKAGGPADTGQTVR